MQPKKEKLRILHTADWHLGLRLYKKDLYEEHRQFFTWLLRLIHDRDIDVLLISGDVFDQANPANETRRLYYDFLRRLIQVNCRVIITGGNHDSPGVLNAPKEILEMLKVHVIGSVPENMEDEVIELHDASGRLSAVVCAVPYIREQDIHRFTLGETYDDKRQQLSAGIRRHFRSLETFCREKFSVPLIAMGHLYAAGAETSDSEREIQIGYQSPVSAEDFPPGFSYIALGHIHRPQMVAKQQRIRYSGSPIPLSFSEKNDKKIVIELEIEGDTIRQTDHLVPVYRRLVRISGTFEEVKKILGKEAITTGTGLPGDAAAPKDELVKDWAELQIVEDVVSPAIQAGLSAFVADFSSSTIEILNHRIISTAAAKSINDLVEDHTNLADLSPVMVISKMMEASGFSEDQKNMIMQVFLELQEMEDETGEE